MGQMLARFSLPTLSASTWRSRFSLWQPSLTVVTEDDARSTADSSLPVFCFPLSPRLAWL